MFTYEHCRKGGVFIKTDLWEQVYESLTCHVLEPWRMPGVENAFADGAKCMVLYGKMRDAYDRLCDRLGVVDEDEDVECIIRCYMDMERELCRLMFGYGQQFSGK